MNPASITRVVASLTAGGLGCAFLMFSIVATPAVSEPQGTIQACGPHTETWRSTLAECNARGVMEADLCKAAVQFFKDCSASAETRSPSAARASTSSIAANAQCTPRQSAAYGRPRCTRAGEQEFGYCESIVTMPARVPNKNYYSAIFTVTWPGGVNGNARLAGQKTSDFARKIEVTMGEKNPSKFCEYAPTEAEASDLREARITAATNSRVVRPNVIRTSIIP